MIINRFEVKVKENDDKEAKNQKIKADFLKSNSPNIVYLISLSLAAVLGAIFIVDGFSELGFRNSLSATGRISYPIFIVIFTASSIYRLFPSRTSQWLYSNRKELGFTFAIAYFYHCIGFFGLYYLTGNFGIEGLELILSIISYFFIIVMTLTSFPGIRRNTSPWFWNSTHTIGMYMYWYFFLQEFLHRGEETSQGFYFVLAGINGIVLAFRIIATTKPIKPRKSSNLKMLPPSQM
jgi:methionine sulfoxide reductase heme-binding subunit